MTYAQAVAADGERSSPLLAIKASRAALEAALTDAGATINRDDPGHSICPFHKEQRGSLSVYEHKTIWRVRCHSCDAGGTIVDVLVHGEGMTVSEAAREVIRRYQGIAEKDVPPSEKTPPREAYSSLDAAARALAYRIGGPCTRQDIYCSVVGLALMAVLRFDPVGDKTYRPLHYDGRSWLLGDPPGRLPLFGLDLLARRPAEVVYVVEGEKTASAVRAMGFLATTSAHGSKSASRSDWAPLAGRRVILWPDNDDAGHAYVADVQAILSTLDPRSAVHILDLADLGVPLPPGGDAADFVAIMARGGQP
jgi:hypothetical protein